MREPRLPALTRVLRVFLILIVIWRHARPKTTWRPPAPAFAGIGAGASFLSALLGSVGPLMAPFFLAYGLAKGAYIGTEALSTVVMHVTKLVAYRQAAILPVHPIIVGLALGPVMVLGSFAGQADCGSVTGKGVRWDHRTNASCSRDSVHP